MVDPTSSYATAGIALRVSGVLKPHHHDKGGDTISLITINIIIMKLESMTWAGM
jgi:hypothetical protein